MNKAVIMRIVGIILILGSIGVVIFSYVRSQNFVPVTATVSDIQYDPDITADPEENTHQDYLVTLKYTVDGKEYTTEVRATDGEYTIGQQQEIRYDPNNPTSTAVGEMNLPILIAICVGILIIGGFVLFKSR